MDEENVEGGDEETEMAGERRTEEGRVGEDVGVGEKAEDGAFVCGDDFKES